MIDPFWSIAICCTGYISDSAKLGVQLQGSPLHRSFSLDELKAATSNFDSSALMGEGTTGKVQHGFYIVDDSVALHSNRLWVYLWMKIVCILWLFIDDVNLFSFSPQTYKGRLENGTLVAIRCLTVSRKFTIRNLKLRLDLLAKLRHPHLVCFLGHCIENEEKQEAGANRVYLIYEYVPNGNFRAHLSGERRLQITQN